MVFNVTFEEIFGAGGGIFQEKTVMPGAQEQEVKPDEGCDALSKVIVAGDEDLIAANIRKNVEIFGVTGTCEAAGILQAKVARSSSSDQDVEADAGYAGLSKVTVQGDANLVASNIKKDVEILGVVGTHDNRKPEQVKTATPAAAGVEIIPDEGKTLSRVNIPAEPNMVPENIKAGESIYGVTGTYETQTEEKSVTPGAQEQEITPAAGKHLSKVIVSGDADLVAGNIRRGITIFDVTGTMDGEKEEQVKNVTPDAAGFDVTPDSGKALSKVVVAGDEDLIPANIKAGVNIFGVDGSYMPSESNFATFVEGTTGTIQIPAVTTIRNTCFQNQGHNYLIPGTVEAIGNYAFDGCSGMTQLVLPAGLTSLGPYAFRNCKNIEGDVIIPEAINDIPGAVFYGCSKIPRFEFKSTFTGSGNNHIQAYAFYNCTNCLVYDFTAAESVPALQNINAFNNHNADLRIIVPDALYNDWIAAANWSNSNISEHIIKESEGV